MHNNAVGHGSIVCIISINDLMSYSLSKADQHAQLLMTAHNSRELCNTLA